jgi:hypothetical protein
MTFSSIDIMAKTRLMDVVVILLLLVNLALLGVVTAIFYVLNSVWVGAQENQPQLAVWSGGPKAG